MAIRAEQIAFSYSDSPVPVLNGFSAAFERDAITAVVGPNGSGKTTLAKILLGILKPQAGIVTIDGDAVSGMTLTDVGRRVGVVTQNPQRQFFCTSVREEIEFAPRNFGCPEEEIVRRRGYYEEIFGLTAYEDCFPFALSAGEKQRVALAAAFAAAPDYLLLDEPTASLDRGKRRALGETLARMKREEHVGVILISHDESFVRACADRVIELGGGGAI